MAKRTYADWLKAEQKSPIGANYASILKTNALIANTPEAQMGGYSAFGSASVPKLAAGTPDWAKRTATEQARVNAAQARAQAETTAQGYSALAPATAPVSPYAAPVSPYDYGAPKTETVTKPATTPTAPTAPSYADLDNASKETMKRNNPALYNQLLAQGMITPVTEETAPTTTTQPASGQSEEKKTESGTESTEPTFADYLALHPEYDEAKRQAEADYYRNRANYGANAETLAQMGIHGGYGDYVDAQAYAQKQQDKANIDQAARQGYAAYLANGGETAGSTNEAASNLYDILTGEDYNLLSYSDEAYATQKERIVADLAYRNVPSAVIDEAFRRVEGMRKKNTDVDVSTIGTATEKIKSGEDVEKYLQTLGVTVAPQRADYESDDAYNEAVEEYKENPSKFLTTKYYDTLDSLYENKKISKEGVSKAIINTLPIYGKDIETSGWKDTGVDIAASIKKVIDAKEKDEITDEDYKAFVEKVKEVLKKAGVTSLKYKDTGVTANLFIRMNVNGDKEDINADQIGGKPDTATLKKLKQYDNLPLAYLKNEDGTFTLYYQNRSGWRQLSTKKGSTDGVPDYGNNWFTAIAFVMMNNGINEEIKTKESNWFKSNNWTYNIK